MYLHRDDFIFANLLRVYRTSGNRRIVHAHKPRFGADEKTERGTCAREEVDPGVVHWLRDFERIRLDVLGFPHGGVAGGREYFNVLAFLCERVHGGEQCGVLDRGVHAEDRDGGGEFGCEVRGFTGFEVEEDGGARGDGGVKAARGVVGAERDGFGGRRDGEGLREEDFGGLGRGEGVKDLEHTTAGEGCRL